MGSPEGNAEPIPQHIIQMIVLLYEIHHRVATGDLRMGAFSWCSRAIVARIPKCGRMPRLRVATWRDSPKT